MTVPVLIFGATGAIGSACARHAHSLGATVTLAVRDINKPNQGLSLEQEKAAGYQRVQADLTQPTTITAAVARSGAKHAFVYVVFSPPGVPDPNRAALKTLKAAGVKFVVFLSHFSVDLYEPSIERAPAHEYTAHAHAQVELALREVFGTSFVALRPAASTRNTFRWAGMVKTGTVRMAYPDSTYAFIAPEDSGRAAATILVGGPSSAPNIVSLSGPEVFNQEDAAKIIGRAVGKDVTVEVVGYEDEVKIFQAALPEHLARHLAETQAKGFEGASLTVKGFIASDRHKVALENARKYAGKGTTLMEWAKENKRIFE
ncbi:hypothetical protein DFH06DRAFT_1083524 [Mycena polygramma]|nr:hypothetical protein DFH06DRAFT_1083524 [Mycena polygramma]